MRQLDPKIAAQRKNRLLQWAIHYHIRTSRPIASSAIAEESGLDLSSATIRNILKELEDEGYLHQPHTSSGRVPTDRGYRFFVDFLQDIQRLASEEKAQIERQYRRRVEEMDRLLSQTSKLLSHVSHSAGFVLSPKLEKQRLKRIELLHLGGNQVLAVLVTQAGQVKHWPVQLSFIPSAGRIHMLNRFLNEHAQGKSVQEVQTLLVGQIEQAELELRELHDLAKELVQEIGEFAQPEALYMEGATSLVAKPEEFGDFSEIRSLMRVMEERNELARLLEDEFLSEEASDPGGKSLVRVRIGRENSMPELKNLSLVTTTYRYRDRVVGVLGILGSKRMEYPRMMSLVDYMGRLVSRTLEEWDGESESERKPKGKSKA